MTHSDYFPLASSYLDRSHVPYSGKAHAVLVVLSDGTFIPGVRLESASFSLTIGALLNAVTTAVALGRMDIVGAVSTRPFSIHELDYLKDAVPDGHTLQSESDRLVSMHGGGLPGPSTEVSPRLAAQGLRAGQLVSLARRVADRAYVPASDFPVGCVIPLDDHHVVPGVNVEHPEWTHILCAERNALGTLVSYGLGTPTALVLSCPQEDNATPCGACRQLIAELAPQASVWMDRGKRPPECVEASSLLPNFFSGASLSRVDV